MEHVGTFGEWVKAQRRALGLTQREFAALVYCASVTLRKIEADQLRPSRELAESIVSRAGVETHECEGLVNWAREQKRERRALR